MRLFVAIDLPAAEKLRLDEAIAGLRQSSLAARWLPAASLHLTLKFLGEVDPARQRELVDALRDAAARTGGFEIALGGLGAFPARGAPRVLWIGVAAPPALSALQRSIEQACERLGFPPEDRPYHPHLTIGRPLSRGPAIARADVDRMAAVFGYKARVRVEQIALMRSHLGSGGARYETLTNVAL